MSSPVTRRWNLGPWERPPRRSYAEAGRSIAARQHFAGKRSRDSLRGRTTMSGHRGRRHLRKRVILLIEPFLEDRDGILWIKELAREYSHTRILIVSRQSEHVSAERALHAGAAGYWMKNGSPEELMHAVETVMTGEIYTSPSITALAIGSFAHRADLPKGLDALSDRQLAVFSIVPSGRRSGEIAKELGIRSEEHTSELQSP